MDDRQDKRERGPLGEGRPEQEDVEATGGGQRPEPVEDRPSVGTVRPEDYPQEQRAKGDPYG